MITIIALFIFLVTLILPSRGSSVYGSLPGSVARRWINATWVSSIDQCPRLPPRRSPPTSVHDLRPDDFSYTMAIGDSITAGAFSRGLQSNIFLDLSEWRGQSYAAGMDDGAITIPNMIKYYNPSATGGSKGNNLFPEVCFGSICHKGPIGWNDNVDQLNAAQFGAMASNLPHEVNDYLIPQVRKWNIPANKYKYINLQIGSNELCWLCAQSALGLGPSSPDEFEADIRATLEALRAAVPNSVVNLLAVFKVSDIFELNRNQPYCSKILPLVPHQNLECACALLDGGIGATIRDFMDLLMNQYNERLIKIATDYQTARYPDFAVLWQPSIINMASYPVEALSSVDCFHPSLKSHELLAIGYWNRLVGTAEEKAIPAAWTTSPTLRCLEEDDRILTSTLVSGIPTQVDFLSYQGKQVEGQIAEETATIFGEDIQLAMATKQSVYRDDFPDVQAKVQQIQQIEISINVLQAQIEELRNERSKIEAELMPFRLEPTVEMTPAIIETIPIDQCPNEILYSIFEYSIAGRHASIRRLLLVCRRFYSLIMVSPRLWARLEIEGIGDLNFIDKKSSSNYIDACLKQSRGLPLDVELWIEDYGDISRSINRGLIDYTDKLVWPLTQNQEWGQVWKLRWTPNLAQCSVLLDSAFKRLLGPNNENVLRWGSLNIRFPYRYGTELWKRLAAAAPNLQSIVFDVSGGPTDVNKGWIGSGLTELSNVRRFESCENFSISILGFSPSNLQHLAIAIDQYLENFRELSSFFNLRTLKLWCHNDSPSTNRITSASLTSEPSFALPALTNLTVDGDYLFLRQVNFNLPVLDTLVIGTMDSFHPLPRLTPKHLHWRTGSDSLYPSEKGILTAIASMLLLSSSVQTFTVEAYYRSHTLRVAARLWTEGRIRNLRHILIIPGLGGGRAESIDVQHARAIVDSQGLRQLLKSPDLYLTRSVSLDEPTPKSPYRNFY